MKTSYKIGFFLTISMLLSVIACKKDLNINPNKAITVTPQNLLASVEGGIAYAQGGDIARFTSIFTQQVSGAANQQLQFDVYNLTSEDFDNVWRFNLYGGALIDLQNLAALSDEKGYKVYGGISRILTAYTLGLTTDLWGDIPYSEAFKGVDNLKPAYDSQQQIYTTIFNLLTEAKAKFAANATSPDIIVPGTDDFIGLGSITFWNKVANALEARYYLHLVKVDPANAQKALDAINAGALNSNADDAAFVFGSTQTTASPWFQFERDRPGDMLYNGYLMTSMDSLQDPRFDSYFDTTGGVPNIGSYYGSISSPVFFMSYAEQKFIEAEAAFRTGNQLGAATAYNDAVKASILKVTGASNPVYEAINANETPGSISLDKIINQKYIALFTHPEVWVDWRRTGFPAITPKSGSNGVPRRFLYPLSEFSYNPSNVPSATLFTKVWWDQ